MCFFKNSVSFIAVMCVCGAAFAAATGRVGVVSTSSAMRRLPSLSNAVKSTAGTTTTTTAISSSTTGTGLLSDSECVDEYRSCMKSDNACGSDFEECTTNVLFHGHMSECFGTLYQCSASGINKLFGTSDLSILSTISGYVDGTVKKDSNGKIVDGEVARYTYPTDGSVMGIDIIGAATRNKLSTSDCVKKYQRCLTKDDVCGADFELCTSDTEFKKQAAMCDSTLSRCQKEGFQQLFGENQMTKPTGNKLKPTDGDAKKWIDDGASLAAANAVNTCYRVVDNCFLNACAKNPYRCVAGVKFNTIATADFVSNDNQTPLTDAQSGTEQTASDVRKFFRSACTDTIGSNKYCYMTFQGKMPREKDLSDPDIREDIFDEAYAARSQQQILGEKVSQLVEKFDKTAKDKCIETFKSCAVRSCGGGSGAACYTRVFGDSATAKTINNSDVFTDIENGCAAIVNTDANCKYMAATTGDGAYEYNYTYSDADAFKTLFPEYNSNDATTSSAPIVAALNADLSLAYNDAAIAQMKKACENVVSNCVASMCGDDYKNCYRSRNDIILGTYATNSVSFNRSMNKTGGVLDYTIVQGLCAKTVENADACAESLAIAKNDARRSDIAGWENTSGNNATVSSAWGNSAANYGYNLTNLNALVNKTNADGKKLCKQSNEDLAECICNTEEGGDASCSIPVMITKDVQLSNTAVNTLFQSILAKEEARAQSIYDAKLTHEQNVCRAQNTGANPDPTFEWVKLNNNRLLNTSASKKNYSINGLGENGSKRSNDLYDSNEIATKVAEKKTGTNAEGDLTDTQEFAKWGISALSGVAGIVGTDLLQNNTGLGGLLSTTTVKDNKNTADDINSWISDCESKAAAVKENARVVENKSKENRSSSNTTESKLSSDDISSLRSAITSLKGVYDKLLSKLELRSNDSYKWDATAFSTANISEYKKGVNVSSIVSAAESIADNCNAMASSDEYAKMKNGGDKTFWNNGGGRAIVDVIGGGATFTAGAVVTHNIMKANNRSEFTAAQQEWIDGMGKKVHCYVGGEFVGDFGDIVSFTITED